jgi:hypothetical protein
MSRWLSNVGNFLERLDDRAEQVADEQQQLDHTNTNGAYDDDDNNDLLAIDSAAGIASILAARGLSQNPSLEEEEEYASQEESPVSTDEAALVVSESPVSHADLDADLDKDPPAETTTRAVSATDETGEQIHPSSSTTPATTAPAETSPAVAVPNEATPSCAVRPDSPPASMVAVSCVATTTTTTIPTSVETPQPPPTEAVSVAPSDAAHSAAIATATTTPSTTTTIDTPGEAATKGTTSPAAAAAPRSSHLTKPSPSKRGPPLPQAPATTAAVAATKELRTLRRSVLSLHQQLEKAEAEVTAQRDELERAAARLEKDRARAKVALQKERTTQASQVARLQAQQAAALEETKARAARQLSQVQDQLRQVQDKRMQEGGDWNMELLDAVHREKAMGEQLRRVEEEKETFLSQIAILTSQQESLGSRLESLSQTADNAMDREREAEQRLDEALSVHAKQLGQRQAREAELERTIANLGQALVKSRQGASSTKANGGTSSSDVNPAKLQNAEQEIAAMRTQLEYEVQRANSLQSELEDLSRERTQEATVSHLQQRHHDRQLADLNVKVAQLESECRAYKEGTAESAPKHGSHHSKDDIENLRQIKQLSEEVLRQREKITSISSELSALKSRLKAANDRASKAETLLESAQNENGGTMHDVELATGGYSQTIRRRRREPKVETIRSALHLDSFSQNKSTEQIGKALDGLDSFLVQSGKVLRYQPLARLFFILYLVMIHLWTFFLIFMHAHGFDTDHSDSHGPHALLRTQVETASVQMGVTEGHA